MAPKGNQESNEEAMQRLMKGKGNKGQGGKGGGKGGKFDRKGGPPSSSELPQGRREELCKDLEEFLVSSAMQLQMPSSINGLERKFLHEQAELRSLTTQSFGQGRDRYMCIFKQEARPQSAGAVMQNPRLTRSQSDPQAGPVVDDGATETDVVENGKISYSAVFLDDESQQKIMEFCSRTLDGGIPDRWKRHCDHMTICVGSLSNPKTEDFRSVADTMQKHISRYQDGQKFELNVVSVGHNEDVIAVGVIGCVSCNRNPHVTVATAPFVAPNASNFINKWRMLEATEQFKVTGQLRQHRSGSHGQGAAPAPAAVAQPSQEDAAAEVKDGFVSHFWHEKRFKFGLVKGETGNECPDGSWFGTGTKKMFGGEEPEWPGMALMLGFSKEDATTFVFQETGKTKGGETVNPRTLPETGGVTVASVPVYSFRAVCGTWVTAIDDGPGPEYYMLSSEPTNHFAFLPLEPNSRWPLASGVPPPDGDCSYGMYRMEKKGTGEFAYWMDGDYPVYIIEDQLCCASDECEPPTRYKVSLMAEKHRVIQVDIDCGGASVISVTCQSVAGETLARFELPSYATLGDLRHQANKVLQPPEEITLSLLNLRSGQVLSPSEDAERLTKL